jgi:DnaJ-domain-containing protein 1
MREASAAYEASTMNTSYDILGVPRRADDEAIRAAFHNAAKACHPDVNADDPAAAQKLKHIIDAYNDLRSPERRAAYDELLRERRRALARRFAVSTVASLAGGGVVLLAVWALGAPQEQIAFAPAASSAPEWARVEASRDASAIAPPSHTNASEAIKVVGREAPQVQEPVGVTTKAPVREPPAAEPEAVTTKVAVREEPAVQALEGDTKNGHREEPPARRLTPATTVKRLAKGQDRSGPDRVHDPARPVTAEIKSPALFGVAF